MKTSILIAISISIWMIIISIVWVNRPQPYEKFVPIPRKANLDGDGVFTIINEYRTKSELHPFIKDNGLCRIADIRLGDLPTDWSHGQFPERVSHDNYRHHSENLAKGYYTNKEVLGAWIDSPAHKKTLDNDHLFACVRCDDIYCVLITAK